MTTDKLSKTLGSMLGAERRFVTFDTDEETRASDVDGALRFSGHAAVFGKRAYIGRKPHGFWESVRSGAFAKAINEGDVRLLHNHDPNLVLARSTVTEGPGSLRLTEERHGLKVEAEFVPTTYGRDIHALVRSGVVSGMSFSFNPIKEEWRAGKDGTEERELLEVTLPDVSTVTFPAYAETDAAARSAGIDLLLDATDLDEAQRSAILGSIRQGALTPDVASALRAASRALAGLAETHQPGEEPTDAESVLARRTQDIHYRMRALMAREGDYSRSKAL